MNCSLERLLAMFAMMEADGFNASTTMKWGFFFVHSSEEPLNAVFAELKNHNYTLSHCIKLTAASGSFKYQKQKCCRQRNSTGEIWHSMTLLNTVALNFTTVGMWENQGNSQPAVFRQIEL